MLTNKQMEDLISAPKKIIMEKFNKKQDDRYLSWNVELEAEGIEGKFSLFIRRHNIFKENYSVGLLYSINGKKNNLIRANGSITQHIDRAHCKPHTHTLTEDDINSGREKNPSKKEFNVPFVSFHEAISYLCTITRISEYEIYFADLLELNLFND